MSIINWPENVPRPQFGLTYNVGEIQNRTKMISGRTMSRQQVSIALNSGSPRILMTSAEYVSFSEFYQNTTREGTQWFKLDIPTPSGETDHFVRFLGGYSERRVGSCLWEITANMQMYEAAYFPDGPPGAGGDPGPGPEPEEPIPIACGYTASFGGGQAFPSVFEVDMPGAGEIFGFRCDAQGVPDKFEIWAEGVMVLSTGYIGSSSYQSALDVALAEKGLPLETIGIGRTRDLTIEKTWTSDKLTVKVYAPLPGTLWTFRVGCPGDKPELDDVDLTGMAGLTGGSKWIGGAKAPNGKIYAAPYETSNRNGLVISPSENTALRSGFVPAEGNKWCGVVFGNSGEGYGIPHNSQYLLSVRPDDINVFQHTRYASGLSGGAKWWDGVLAGDGKIYGVPYSSTDILIITDTPDAYSIHSRTNMGADLSGSAKWRGGVLGSDGKIYCVPYTSTDILIIDPIAQTAERTDMGADLSGSNKWSGAVLGSDGKIYCVPYTSTDILVIDPVTQTAERTNMGADLTGVAKWMGGVLGGDGRIYCSPYNSATILIIDPITQTAERTNMGANLSGSAKWSGAVLGDDGVIYCIPYGSTSVLKIS